MTTTTEPRTATAETASLIEELFCQGHSIEHIIGVGADDGWTPDDVKAVLRNRQWDLDGSGRLPRSKRITAPRGLRAARLPAAPSPAPSRPAPPVQTGRGVIDTPPLDDWQPDDAEEEATPDVDVADELADDGPPDSDGELSAPVAGGDQEATEAADPHRSTVPPQDAPVASSAYIAVLQAREFGVDHSYQRPLDEARVRRMVATWDPRMVGVLDVSDRGHDRPEGTPRYAVINGQHRAAAAARVSPAGADIWMACNVHEGLTVPDEARLMHELDRTTKKLIGWDKWRARRVAGDETVLAAERVAARHGLRIDNGIGAGYLRAYAAAEKLVTRGGEELLDSTLTVLSGAYGDAATAYQAPLVSGVGQLLQGYGASVNVERLIAALRATKPEQLRATATAMRDIDGGALSELMTRAVVGQYNRTAGQGGRLGADRG